MRLGPFIRSGRGAESGLFMSARSFLGVILSDERSEESKDPRANAS